MLLGVDVGGTFTDAVLLGDGVLVTAKAPTTPEDQSLGVMAAVEAALGRAGRDAVDVTAFAHGMTVATNALLEGHHARTALVVTEGFTDVVELGRQARADLYRLCVARPAPLVPPELRFGAPERMTPDGPLRELTPDAAEALAREVAAAAPEAVAVVLLHAYRHPQHERELRDALAHALPDAHVSLSHEVVGTFREYERAATTEIDAALSPLVGRYLRQLATRTQAASLPEPAIMQSNGGLTDVESAATHAALTVLSGPAGGAAGAAFTARAAGVERALCLDMGGTSADVCVVHDGAVAETGASEIAGRPIALPTLDVHTVGAGGGSIAWRDAGGALRVGPRSAGAVPGPACYGRGGREPTVTDANLLLGHLPDDVPLAGGVMLDRAAAERAVSTLARELELDTQTCAAGIVRVANAEMTRALRVVTVERGIDPRDHALVAFGGAGPLHAVAIAEELGIERVIVPRTSGVLAALGLVVAPRRRDAQRSVLRSGSELTAEAIADDVAQLAAAARDALGEPDAAIAATYELRYRGQAFELAIPSSADQPAATPAALREAFEAAHEERYGYRDAEQEVELVTVRVSATTPAPLVPQTASTAGGPTAGTTIPGPAVVPLPESTLVIPAGWCGSVLPDGAIDVQRNTSEAAA
ncbi:MAG TPA: hydantoinase/oxoprolinase family protein [Conexibacter sp.]|jgi:N-methylhydantoinase A|nr:hydantoinase/oxoprolinase family protein [Conexibacter sp.]